MQNNKTTKLNDRIKNINEASNNMKELILNRNTIIKGITFDVSALADAISYLIHHEQGNINIPYIDYEPIDEIEIYSDSYLFLVKNLYLENNLFYCDNRRQIYKDILQINNQKNKEVTFTYLIQLYNIDHSFNKDEYNVSDFDFKDYEYVKEFIAFIAMLQIKNGGKHLSSDKILAAVNDFIILKKNKPKKRIKK